MLLTAASLRYLKYNRQDFFPLHVALRVTEQFHNRIWDRNELLGMFVGLGGIGDALKKGLGEQQCPGWISNRFVWSCGT